MTQQTAQTLGQLLLQARLDSGKSVQELHEATLVSVKYLTALEQNAFDELPSAAYIKGYVRRIAEVLSTPAEPLIAAYDNRLAPVTNISPLAASTIPAAAAAAAEDNAEPCHASSNRNYFVDLVRLTQHLVGYLWSDIFPWIRDHLPGKRLLLLLLLLAIAVSAYRLWPTTDVSSTESVVEAESVIVEEVQTTEPMSEVSVPNILAEELTPAPASSVVIEPAAIPEPTPEPAPTPVAAVGPDRIEMNFYGPSVVRVTDADGKPIASGLKRAGDSIRARGRQPFKIQVGNPDVTDIRVNSIVVQGTPL